MPSPDRPDAPRLAAAADDTPHASALTRYADRGPARATVPEHKGGEAGPAVTRALLGAGTLALDVPTHVHGVDPADEGDDAPLRAAERLAAEAWGARRTFFLVNGASQGNHAACLAVAHAARPVVVQRSAHGSTFDGLALAGLDARYVAPQVDHWLGIALTVTPEALDAALRATPDAAAAFVVSPTCHGVVADVRGLAETAHRHGAALVVDETWGAHLAFGDRLPDDALSAGADLVVSSTDRHLGSLTGSAMLHLGHGAPEWLDEHAVAAALRLVGATSPSRLLRASLDTARHHAQTRGAELLERTLDDLARLRDDIRAIPGLEVLDERDAGRPGMAAHDPLRVCVDVSGTGATGWEIARAARAERGVELELAEERVVVAAFGLGEDVGGTGARLVTALRSAARVRQDAGARAALRRSLLLAVPGGEVAPPVVSLREAALSRSASLPVEAAAGAIAAEALTPYPPGIPAVLPGERLDRTRLAALREALRAGARLRGASDPTLATVRVLAEHTRVMVRPSALEEGLRR